MELMAGGKAELVTTESWIRTLIDRKLVAEIALEEALVAFGGDRAATTPDALSKALVGAGLLTPFQAECVLAGQSELLEFGQYLVLERIGAGAMGTVYRARHRLMNRIVAIKMMTTEASRKPGFCKRFEREVQTLAQLHHPNIVMAFDAGEWQGRPFLVMEFVKGRDLATEVSDHGPLSIAEAVDCVIQAARGLSYAHAQGLVHRDIKPANLLREPGGIVKVADLGIARVQEDTDHQNSITQVGDFIGSAAYSSPEQALDATTVDGRADVYALGCTLFYLLTGRPPFVANSLMALLLMHRDQPIPRLTDFRRDAPEEFNELLHKMLAKTANERIGSMDAVVERLESLRTRLKLSAQRPTPQPFYDPVASTPTEAFQSLHDGADALAHAQTMAQGPTHQTTECVNRRDLMKLSIVLVEPSRFQAKVTRGYFESLGITRVRTTDSGREAIALIDEEGPDVIISALHLRDMSGAELVRTLSSRPGSKLAFVLASTETESKPEDSVEGVPKALVLPKPYSLDQLAQTLSQVMAFA